MKAEFQSRVNPDHSLPVPPEIASQIPDGRPVQVILLWGREDSGDWEKLTVAEFLKGYADCDAIYDEI
ncbi:MAG: hypothetical protein HY013_13500 [Candidatus Solibacter usitatus]|nr:hypothetical protein [Candidatus Solibacter usitatus]